MKRQLRTQSPVRKPWQNDGIQQKPAEAGVLLALDGLLSAFHWGARFVHRRQTCGTDGPFAEAKEVIGGYWIIQVRSREEAIEWAKRAPMANNEIIEVRQIHEMGDFPEEVQKAGEGFEDLPNAAAAKG